MHPIATALRVLLAGTAIALGVSSCGGRGPLLDLELDGGSDARATGAGGRHAGSGGKTGSGGARSDGGASGFGGDVADASPSRDASSDSAPSDGATADASDGEIPDALTSPDCTCPPDTYFIDVTVNGTSYRLSGPYGLGLYCPETTVQMEHPPCSQVYSLTGCKDGAFEPPCLYLSIDLSRRPLIGNFMDATGQTWDMKNLSMTVDPFQGRVSTGHFDADFGHAGDAGILTASGSFRACAARLPRCER